jgi:hypothetical protein
MDFSWTNMSRRENRRCVKFVRLPSSPPSSNPEKNHHQQKKSKKNLAGSTWMRQDVSPPTFETPRCPGGQQKYKTVMKLSRLHGEVNVTTSKVTSQQTQRSRKNFKHRCPRIFHLSADSRKCHDKVAFSSKKL